MKPGKAVFPLGFLLLSSCETFFGLFWDRANRAGAAGMAAEGGDGSACVPRVVSGVLTSACLGARRFEWHGLPARGIAWVRRVAPRSAAGRSRSDSSGMGDPPMWFGERARPACCVRRPAGQFWAGRPKRHAGKMPVLRKHMGESPMPLKHTGRMPVILFMGGSPMPLEPTGGSPHPFTFFDPVTNHNCRAQLPPIAPCSLDTAATKGILCPIHTYQPCPRY